MKRHLAMISLFLTMLFIFSGCGKGISDGALFDNAKAMVAEVKSGITEITYEDFKEKLEAEQIRVLIDVREASEFDTGYINEPDEDFEYPYPETFTVNIPRGLLEFKIADQDFWDNDLWVEMPSKDEEIILYCKSGGRSALAALSLQQLGYKVKSLKGGYRKWLDPEAPEEEEAPKSSGGCG